MKSPSALSSAARPAAGLYVKETVLLLVLAVALPVVVHLIPAPDGVAWGARLLAMFYAPLLGVLFFRLHVGLIPALLAPTFNALLTGMPGGAMTGLLTAELVVFTLIVYALHAGWPRFRAAAPLSYLAAKGVSALLVAVVPAFAVFGPAIGFTATAVLYAVPGLLVLLLLNVWAVRRAAS